ncbi:MAG: acetyl-CoA carboxylase carboxyl transferase subunit beta [Chloroflexi bacterium]|nr:acetyl-CoA carboxylase carboxyl transferase subunit beta [Chloroflexota bacterium]
MHLDQTHFNLWTFLRNLWRIFWRKLGAIFPRRARITCSNCDADLWRARLFRDLRVCHNCGHHFPITARKRIALLMDRGAFQETEKDFAIKSFALSAQAAYPQLVRAAQHETHLREAVITGVGKIDNARALFVVLDFNFMGGSMGAVVGEKIARAFEFAAAQKMPLVAFTASGGARIQEGMLALMQMAKTTAAAQKFRAAHLPFITILTHPTTGGVYASFANLADFIFAEPRALIGFAGPRVVEALTRQKLPPDSHHAEFLLEHGMIDAIVPRTEQRAHLARILKMFTPSTAPKSEIENFSAPEPTTRTAWEIVELARRADRPTALDYIQKIFDDFIELRGDRFFGDDSAIVGGIASLNGQTVIVIGQERGRGAARAQHRGGRAEPEGYRKAQRLMRLAANLELPLITLVDTPGADPSYESEKRGVAMSIAHCLAAMIDLPVPTIAVVIGEGGSGGALALAAADRVLMLEHAIYSVISPEGASAILYGDAQRADQVAGILRLTARDLRALGIIDTILAEPRGGAHLDPEFAARSVCAGIAHAFVNIGAARGDALKNARYEKYRRIGKM